MGRQFLIVVWLVLLSVIVVVPFFISIVVLGSNPKKSIARVFGPSIDSRRYVVLYF